MNPAESRLVDSRWKGLAISLMVLAPGLLPACADRGGFCYAHRQIRPPQSGVQIYDTSSGSWSQGTPMPVRLDGVRATSLGGLIYAVSGTTALRFDPVADTWDRLPDPSGQLRVIDVVTIGLSLFVVRSDGMGTTELEELDTVAQAWSAGPSTATGHSAAVELGGLIYAVGRALESFDPLGGAWQVLTPPPLSARVATAETDGTQLYAFGDSVEVYDPALDSWSNGPIEPWAAPIWDLEMDSTASGLTIYVVAGPSEVYALDTTSLSWTAAADPPRDLREVGAVADAGQLFLLGGFLWKSRSCPR